MGMEEDWKIFWRITFDVFNGSPRLQLEMTLWKRFLFQRLGRLVDDLAPGITPIGTAYYVDDRAVFFGGYLECAIDLNSHARELLVLARIDVNTEEVLGQASTSLHGENVSIRADVVLYGQSAKVAFPIFYFPQPDTNGIRLVESVAGGGGRTIEWEISNQVLPSNPNFALEEFNAQHGLRVRQDKDTASGDDVYEFLVDSIPLDSQTAAPKEHLFSGDPQIFYIGKTPDHPDGLFGEIAHLEFDPNSSCTNCAG